MCACGRDVQLEDALGSPPDVTSPPIPIQQRCYNVSIAGTTGGRPAIHRARACAPGLRHPEAPVARNECGQAVASRGCSGRPRTSKNSAWLMIALTLSGWNGLVIRNVGSGRVPVSSRCG